MLASPTTQFCTQNPLNERLMMKHKGILICDYGSQYTFLIARKLRELGAYSEIIDGRSDKAPEHFEILGIILSGSPKSVKNDKDLIPTWVVESGKPILGICYGMQVLTQVFGGQVRAQEIREYGRSTLHLKNTKSINFQNIFAGIPENSTVWMSHGDDVHTLPPDFECLAISDDGTVAAFAHQSKAIVGLQFHPEVHHSEYGQTILKNFLSKICKMSLDWSPKNALEQANADLRKQVEDNDKILLAISGGVDSTVCGVLLTRALGRERVSCIFIDHGFLRQDEAETMLKNLTGLGLDVKVLERSALFLKNIEGEADPEKKRKSIGHTFIQAFEDYIDNLAHDGKSYTHLAQGTLYSDVIESAGSGSQSAVIKSHHNVGGLPPHMKLKVLEPFRYLFKDEVRALGKELGIPDALLYRHPFPGPGLAIRIVGEVSTEKLIMARKADHIFIDSLRKENLYEKIWQAGVIILPVKSVGVMGDERTYQWTCVLRAVHAVDAMTAEVGDLPLSFLCGVANKIIRNVPGINRVLYDVSSKPPATIEWE